MALASCAGVGSPHSSKLRFMMTSPAIRTSILTWLICIMEASMDSHGALMVSGQASFFSKGACVLWR